MKQLVVSALEKVVKIKKEEIESLIEQPKDQSMGDLAFPCFSLAKKMKKNPTSIAQEIASNLKNNSNFDKVEAVGPYVNFFISFNKISNEIIGKILEKGEKFGSIGVKKEKVMIEFSQANTHKAFHVGHISGTSLGESIARIMSFCGQNVTRVNYQGDTGMHVAKWIWNYKKFHKDEKIKNDEGWFAKIYVEAVKRLADNPEYEKEVERINLSLEEKKDKGLVELWKKTRKICLESLDKVYLELDTRFDKFFFESEMEERGKEISKELVKIKIAKISDGATIIDFKDHGFPELGVWVLLRKDGTVLYSAKDIALAEKKFNDFKIDRAVYVVGSEQRLHIMQLFKTLELMKFKNAKNCVYVPVTLVRLPTGKMSSRTGDNVLYSSFKKELMESSIEEIKKRYPGLGKNESLERAQAISLASVKYAFLKQDTNKVIVFDKNEATRFEGDTGPYLLYSYARAKSILKKAKYKPSRKITLPENVEESERILITHLGNFSDSVRHAFEGYSPSRIAHYAYHLAQRFNEFYQSCKVIGSPEEKFRLSVVDAFSQVLRNSLDLLGIPVIDEM